MLKKSLLFLSLCLAVTACGDDPDPKALNGEACEVNDDCESNECWLELTGCNPFFGCSTYELTDGMCSAECDWDDTAEDPLARSQGTCDDGEWCLVYNLNSAQICFQDCLDDGTCAREDYQCVDIGSGISTCLPPDDAARVVEDPNILQTAAPIYESFSQ